MVLDRIGFQRFLDRVSRRDFLRGGIGGGVGAIATGAAAAGAVAADGGHASHGGAHGGSNITVGQVNHEANGFDPHDIATDWDTGVLTTEADGRKVRTFEVVAVDKEIEIAPGIMFPAWTYNGRIPGPTFRATEGEWLRFHFVNDGSHPHSMHFHGIHSAAMDGVPGAGMVDPGKDFTYEMPAKPFGCHLYHCHAFPLKRHMHKGLYGAFIIDPDPALHPEHADVARSRLLGSPENAKWQEFVMVMNGFDTNFDEENEVYAVNSIAFAYAQKPIRVEKERPIRVYLVNVTEFDPVNSLHLHANFFNYFDHGTTLTPTLVTVDTIMQCQAQRGIVEIDFSQHEPGHYMFHAHQAEFTELGWMANFEVV
ncbi:MAG: multicopper oxidase domain-containing protein [Rhizobiales bacterium]|nr:multicopper oxidase domain-containing protein [Hyphomicrobiales bacterium]